jgi:pyridoxamine 5'-phosphate oxidase family protein
MGHIQRTKGDAMTEQQRAGERIIEQATAWPGVGAAPGRRGELSLKVAGREIGHLHGDHAAHFSFPAPLWRELRDAGRIVEHPVFPGREGPAARRIESDADVADVIALLHLNYERVIAAHPPVPPAGVFTRAELGYLSDVQPLARLATVGADGTPHVVPVGWTLNARLGTIDVGGIELERSKKFRDIARSGRAAIVIDDLASASPWRPRGIEVRGRAEAVTAPKPLIRIHPRRVVSWGLGEPRSARTVEPAEAAAA